MVNLSTKYMGLNLNNPIIVASSGFTKNAEDIRRCADAGAGAVVLKSLFEEQIWNEMQGLMQYTCPPGHPEACQYIEYFSAELGPHEYLMLIEKAKSAVSIPVIASLNCILPRWWVNYAKQIESAGADALELNISIMNTDTDYSCEEIEEMYYKTIEDVRSNINIPIAMKIGPYFTSIAKVTDQFCKRGASAVVLFNRFYQLDIDIEKLELKNANRFSLSQEISLPIRWIGILSGRVTCDLCAATGIHDGTGVIKQLLAGASAVQICSTLYLNGYKQIDRMLKELEKWMKRHNFNSIDQIQGKMSQKKSGFSKFYERTQYVKALSETE